MGSMPALSTLVRREETSRAVRGDSARFAAIYRRHHQALYRYCRSIVRHDEDAHDALQNTFEKAFTALQERGPLGERRREHASVHISLVDSTEPRC